MIKCPGQDQRFWKPQDIFEVKCQNCGTAVEFFKDEPKLKCHKCGRTVVNPKIDLGCAEWCQYADQCLGVSVGRQISAIRDKLIDEMKKVFAGDQRRIEHTLGVLDYAERIQAEEGGDAMVVKAAAILHDIGIAQAERKYGSSAAKYHQIEGPIMARGILAKYDLDKADVEHICRIIASHHTGKDIDTIEFNIVWDADRLINVPAELAGASKERLKEIIDKTFRTCTGRNVALELFVKN
jgi:putative nucleotidyltransferase with HDIG domain